MKNKGGGAWVIGVLTLMVVFAVLPPLSSLAQTTTTTNAVKPFSFSLVPPDCYSNERGCSICEVGKVFTNGAAIIAGGLSATSLLMFVIGGFFLIFSAGEAQRVEKGKKILLGTVTGLAIVFLAWFAVNVIVRLAASSGQSTQTGLASSATLFTSVTGKSFDWWNSLEHCQPALPSSCKGYSVGDLCGGGETGCAGSTACVCYRPLDDDGDDNVCADSATDASSASAADKTCSCSSFCSITAIKLNKSYECVSSSTAATGYTVATGVSCPIENYVCAVKN